MRTRFLAGLSALLLTGNALLGVGWSGATWTAGTSTALAVVAASDWTPPSVSVSAPSGTVQGTVTVTATASDTRSAIDPASVVVEYRAAGASTWTAFPGCTVSGTNPVTASCSGDTTLLPDGDYELRARATDTAGYSATSATSAITVRNSAAVRLTRVATYLRGTVPVTGSVVSSGGASSAQLYLESSPSGSSTFSQLNGACTAGPVSSLTCQWNTTGVADGTYDVRARAVTSSTTTDVQAGVVVDNTAPTAALSVPAGVLSGHVALDATASDATSGVASVALQYRTGTGAWSTCTPTTGTYSCALDTTTLTNGATYAFQAVVTDAAGNTTTTAAQSRVVDNSPATVAITSPASGTVLGGVTTITVTATSPRSVSSVRVEYRTGSGAWATACTASASPWSCSWDTKPLGGSYELRAVAVETFGGATPVSASVPITINNSDGAVSVSAPAANAVVSGTVTLQASTTSPTGVTSVALQARKGTTGTWTTVCTDTTSPYTCDWVTPTEYNTSWQLQAVMTQGNQRVVTSAAVPVTVRNVTGSVAVTSPVNGATVHGMTTVTVDATSNAGVTSVDIQYRAPGGSFVTICTDTTAPYTCTQDTSSVAYDAYAVQAVMTRGDGTKQTSAVVTATIDNRTFAAYDVQGRNGGTAGIPDQGDQITLTYTALADLSTIQSGLTYGTASALAVSLTGSTGTRGDIFSFTNANLGSVTAASNFYGNNRTMSYTGSTLLATRGSDANGDPVTVLTITLGRAGDTTSNRTTAGSMTWTPSGAVSSAAGVASSTTLVTERGVGDRDF